jgi:replicative DNA helicase
MDHIYESYIDARANISSIENVVNHIFEDVGDLSCGGNISGIPSGFADIDRITGGWQNGDLIVIGGFQSAGKTSLVLNFARNAAVDSNIPVLVISIDSGKQNLARKLLVAETGLSSSKFNGTDKLEPYEWEKMECSAKNLAKAPLNFEDRARLETEDIGKIIYESIKKDGTRLVIVDSLNLVQSAIEYRGNREQEVSSISRELKRIARELDLPLITTCQLSRSAEARQENSSNSRLRLSDIRETASIEYDADIVIMIHSNGISGISGSYEDSSNAQLMIVKNRHGETADVDVRFCKEECKFKEIENIFDGECIASSMSFESDDFSDNGPKDFE